MANEITVASMISDGAFATFVVTEYEARNSRPDDLRAALTQRVYAPNMGASSMRIGTFDDDHEYTAASSEISGGVGNADPDWGNFALTPARRLLPMQMSDLLKGSAGAAGPTPALFVDLMFKATGKTITNMACAAAVAATEEVGDGTGPMTVDLFHQAMTALDEATTPAPYNMVLTPKAYGEFQESLRGEMGSAVFNPATEQQLSASGGTYRGSWRNVGIYVTDRVDTSDAGAVAQNFMLGRNGINYCEAPIGPYLAGAVEAGNTVLDLGVFGVVVTYDEANGLTKYTGNYMPAVSLGEDSAVVRIQTATGA